MTAYAFQYLGGEFLQGVPARHLTADDVRALPEQEHAELLACVAAGRVYASVKDGETLGDAPTINAGMIAPVELPPPVLGNDGVWRTAAELAASQAPVGSIEADAPGRPGDAAKAADASVSAPAAPATLPTLDSAPAAVTAPTGGSSASIVNPAAAAPGVTAQTDATQKGNANA